MKFAYELSIIIIIGIIGGGLFSYLKAEEPIGEVRTDSIMDIDVVSKGGIFGGVLCIGRFESGLVIRISCSGHTTNKSLVMERYCNKLGRCTWRIGNED